MQLRPRSLSSSQGSRFSRKLNAANNAPSLNSFSPTGSERYVCKLLPGGGVLSEVTVRLELHPLVPGVVQPVVDGRGDADLVAGGDGESCRRLSEAGEERRAFACRVSRRL